MKKMYQVIAGILFVGFLGCFAYKKHHNETTRQSTENIVPLNGEQTAQRIAKLYNKLGPKIGVHLVEPNTVITMAGLRGQGNFLMHGLNNKEKYKLEKINKSTKKFGIKFIVDEDIEDEIINIIVSNTKGAEYSSKLSKLPFVTPFDSSTGYDGYKVWIIDVFSKAKKYFENKKQPGDQSLEDQTGHLIIGLTLGYPDQALLDAYYADDHSQLTYSNIPYSDYYENPQPNFDYLSEHEQEESIASIKKSWGTLLEEFYNSSWHKTIAKDPIFIKTIESERKAHDDWFIKKRLNMQPAT